MGQGWRQRRGRREWVPCSPCYWMTSQLWEGGEGGEGRGGEERRGEERGGEERREGRGGEEAKKYCKF